MREDNSKTESIIMLDAPEPKELPEFLTPDEVAAILHKSPHTLKLWRRLKIGPTYTKLDGKTILYPKELLQRYMAAGLVVARTRPLSRSGAAAD
jgi:hypothetical protein